MELRIWQRFRVVVKNRVLESWESGGTLDDLDSRVLDSAWSESGRGFSSIWDPSLEEDESGSDF